MNSYSVLIDRKNIAKILQSNQHIQCNPYQSDSIFHRNRKDNPKIYLKLQNTWNNQDNIEKE